MERVNIEPEDDVWVSDYLPWVEGRCPPERRMVLKEGKWVIESMYPSCRPEWCPMKEQESVKPQDAEMLIIHNGGAEEYVKDIESIVLLAHKDYDIVYCGNFAKGTEGR